MPVRIAATYAIIFNVTSTLIQSAFEVWIILEFFANLSSYNKVVVIINIIMVEGM